MKRKLTVQTPRGTFTRTTARLYTHIVVYDGAPANGATWHGSLRLAEKARQSSISWAEKWIARHPDDRELRDAPQPAIFPITQADQNPRQATHAGPGATISPKRS